MRRDPYLIVQHLVVININDNNFNHLNFKPS